jgi:hypothetical protein
MSLLLLHAVSRILLSVTETKPCRGGLHVNTDIEGCSTSRWLWSEHPPQHYIRCWRHARAPYFIYHSERLLSKEASNGLYLGSCRLRAIHFWDTTIAAFLWRKADPPEKESRNKKKDRCLKAVSLLISLANVLLSETYIKDFVLVILCALHPIRQRSLFLCFTTLLSPTAFFIQPSSSYRSSSGHVFFSFIFVFFIPKAPRWFSKVSRCLC